MSATTIDLLIAGANGSNIRKDSAGVENTDHESKDFVHEYVPSQPPTGASDHVPDTQRFSAPSVGNGHASSRKGSWQFNSSLQPPHAQRKVSYGLSAPDDNFFDDDEAYADAESNAHRDGRTTPAQISTTLYFAGLSEHTTMRDLLSVIKGGKILSINMRNSGATVAFFDGAADFLQWTKRNDIYLQGRRVSCASPRACQLIC